MKKRISTENQNSSIEPVDIGSNDLIDPNLPKWSDLPTDSVPVSTIIDVVDVGEDSEDKHGELPNISSRSSVAGARPAYLQQSSPATLPTNNSQTLPPPSKPMVTHFAPLTTESKQPSSIISKKPTAPSALSKKGLSKVDISENYSSGNKSKSYKELTDDDDDDYNEKTQNLTILEKFNSALYSFVSSMINTAQVPSPFERKEGDSIERLKSGMNLIDRQKESLTSVDENEVDWGEQMLKEIEGSLDEGLNEDGGKPAGRLRAGLLTETDLKSLKKFMYPGTLWFRSTRTEDLYYREMILPSKIVVVRFSSLALICLLFYFAYFITVQGYHLDGVDSAANNLNSAFGPVWKMESNWRIIVFAISLAIALFMVILTTVEYGSWFVKLHISSKYTRLPIMLLEVIFFMHHDSIFKCIISFERCSYLLVSGYSITYM